MERQVRSSSQDQKPHNKVSSFGANKALLAHQPRADIQGYLPYLPKTVLGLSTRSALCEYGDTWSR